MKINLTCTICHGRVGISSSPLVPACLCLLSCAGSCSVVLVPTCLCLSVLVPTCPCSSLLIPACSCLFIHARARSVVLVPTRCLSPAPVCPPSLVLACAQSLPALGCSHPHLFGLIHICLALFALVHGHLWFISVVRTH